MKIITIKIEEKTYMSGKITAYLTKEAMKLQRDALELGKNAKRLPEDADEDATQGVFDDLVGLMDRKVWLICESYGKQFTPDDLERELTSEEIDIEVNKIISAASGVIEKN